MRAKNITNRSKKFAAALAGATLAGFTAVAESLRDELKDVVGEQFDGTPSKPGEPPKRRTGKGQDSIESESSRVLRASRVAVRSSGKHMIIHERGRAEKKRPWFVKTLSKSKGRLAKLLLGTAKKKMDQAGDAGGGGGSGGPGRDERGRFISQS